MQKTFTVTRHAKITEDWELEPGDRIIIVTDKVREDKNTKTAKCPECGTDYLVNTGYCPSCEKKVAEPGE